MSNTSFDLPLPEDGETAPYSLVGSARALPGKADELEAALLAMVSPTRKEEGVLQYHVHRDRHDPDLFIFYEAWRTVGDLKEHLAMPYIQSFLSRHKELVDGDLQVTWLKMLSSYES
ncbi:putative quinol monooxygenase [Roseibium algae]|uniref:Quinol monooxygenase n=1 Tax=Roseibium algae TaxID=3123038 RepID=A0ABU8TGT2_9HYPH